jgi:hypothetical protein
MTALHARVVPGLLASFVTGLHGVVAQTTWQGSGAGPTRVHG